MRELDKDEQKAMHAALLKSVEVVDEGSMSASPALLPCPKCGCDDLEGSPYPVDRQNKQWAIVCGHPRCGMYLESTDVKILTEVWNLVAR